jgi:hypothetical protein
MIIDAGRGNYTARTFSKQRYELWFTRSEYHNLPIVNGIGQKAGRNYEAHQVKAITNDKEASLAMNIAASYPKEAGITVWNRLVKLNRIKNIIELSDNYVLSASPTAMQQVLMTICNVDLSQQGKILLKGNNNVQLIVHYDPKVWSIATDKPSTEGMEYESFKTKWGRNSITRLIFNKTTLESKGQYKISFTTE